MEVGVVKYIYEKPYVKSYCNSAVEKYETIKNKSSIVNCLLSSAASFGTAAVSNTFPLAKAAFDSSLNLIGPIATSHHEKLEQADKYVLDKFIETEKKLSDAYSASCDKIHKMRLSAEDFFIGKCIHKACESSFKLLGFFEYSLERTSLIKKRNTANVSQLSAEEEFNLRLELLKSERVDCKNELVKLFANPELWNERLQECRVIGERINKLNNRIIQDGFLSGFFSDVAKLLSLITVKSMRHICELTNQLSKNIPLDSLTLESLYGTIMRYFCSFVALTEMTFLNLKQMGTVVTLGLYDEVQQLMLIISKHNYMHFNVDREMAFIKQFMFVQKTGEFNHATAKEQSFVIEDNEVFFSSEDAAAAAATEEKKTSE